MADRKLDTTTAADGIDVKGDPESLEAAFEQADREIDEALAAERARIEESVSNRDVFVNTLADVPAGARPIAKVRNRPYTYFIFGMVALAVIAYVCWMVRPGYLIGVGIIAALVVGLTFFIDNRPVIDIYEDFVVVYKERDPEKVCIIPNERILYWTVVQQYTSVVEIFIKDEVDPEKTVCVPIHSLNTYKVSGLLDHHMRDKALVEIQREMDRRKREQARRERAAKK